MPQPPAVIGRSNVFLTKLAAQERRVLELREELEKAENELSRLKKQWAQHEAVKKRNEFRHQAQLEQLRSATRYEKEVDKRLNNGRASVDTPDHPNVGAAMVGSVTRQNSVEKSRHLSSTRQTQRKMFAGSRHARTLSLLSTSSVLQRSSRQLADKPTFRDSSAIQISTVALNNAQGSNIQSPVSPLTRYESGNGKSKEVFIETGKQLVGDLREGLWTFFEDLRQATVGEEASSIPYYSSKVRPFSRHNVRMKDHRKDESPGMLRKTEKRLDESQAPITSRSNAVEHRLSATQAVEKEKETEMEEVRPNIQQNGVGTPSIESDEDESWDVWDTPVAKGSVPREQSESVTSGSLASPSANDYSPRSSMSSLDSTPFPLHNQMSSVPPGEIPWPAITNLSRGNSRMTATSLMSEWEKSFAKPLTPNAAFSPRTNSLIKSKKAD